MDPPSVKRGADVGNVRKMQFETARRILFGKKIIPGTNRETWTSAGFLRYDEISFNVPFPLGDFTFLVSRGSPDPDKNRDAGFFCPVWLECKNHMGRSNMQNSGIDENFFAGYDTGEIGFLLVKPGWLCIGFLTPDELIPILPDFASSIRLLIRETELVEFEDDGGVDGVETEEHAVATIPRIANVEESRIVLRARAGISEALSRGNITETEVALHQHPIRHGAELDYLHIGDYDSFDRVDMDKFFSGDYSHRPKTRYEEADDSHSYLSVVFNKTIPDLVITATIFARDDHLRRLFYRPEMVSDETMIKMGLGDSHLWAKGQSFCVFGTSSRSIQERGNDPIKTGWVTGDVAYVCLALSALMHVLSGPDTRNFFKDPRNKSPMKEVREPEPLFFFWKNDPDDYSEPYTVVLNDHRDEIMINFVWFFPFFSASEETKRIERMRRRLRKVANPYDARDFPRGLNIILHSKEAISDLLAIAKHDEQFEKYEFLGCHMCGKKDCDSLFKVKQTPLQVCSRACYEQMKLGGRYQ